MPTSPMRSFRQIVATLLLVSSLLFTTGCREAGRETWPVSGAVTFDGAPLQRAIVMFQPTDGRPSMALTDQKGCFELVFTRDRKGAPAGLHQVRIYFDAALMGDSPIPFNIPQRYNTETELTYTVTQGENFAEFKLESDRADARKSRAGATGGAR